jgi:hypothetical protein
MAERARLNAEEPVRNGDVVEVEGKLYRVRVKGNYSDCAVLDPLHAFNTGRRYTSNGQRIAWTRLSSGNVAMLDIDRMIDYVLPFAGKEVISNADVLRSYDTVGGKMEWNKRDWDEARELQQALRVAANQENCNV